MNEDPIADWREALEAETWYFIARGFGAQVTPLALEVEGEGAICVFSSPSLAESFGLAMGLDPTKVTQLLAIPALDAVDYLLGFLEDGVRSLVLDPGTRDSALQLAALPHVRAWIADNPA